MLLAAAVVACCTVTGTVHAESGRPIANAQVSIVGKVTKSTTSDAHGRFSVYAVAGAYEVFTRADGFATADVGPIQVDHDVLLDVSLQPDDAQHLRSIAEVTVDGRLAISRSAIPSIVIGRDQFEAAGYDRIIEGLAEVPSVSFARPDGGAASAPSLIALRGPDPSETLIALDGQILNDGNTGDLDLSRFPVAAFRNVDVTEGLGAKDSEGSNTIGGAVNMISLQPTRDAHTAFSLSSGSFGRTEGWYNATGAHGHFGYALGFDDQQERGYVDQDVQLQCIAPSCTAPAIPMHLGSTISSRSALANLTWSFSPRSDIGLRVFTLGNHRDESGVFNTPLNPAAQGAGDLFTGPGNAAFAQSIRAYDLRGRARLGSGQLSADFSLSNNSVSMLGTGPSPYDVSHQDKRQTLSMQWGRTFDRSEFELGGYVQNESLLAQGVDGLQKQRISSYFMRGGIRANQRIRVNAAIFASNYSSFGSNIDGRLGASYDFDSSSALRFSVGTGFRAPLLVERYIFPIADLPLDQNCVATGQGNAVLKPEHATEYELGYSKAFSWRATLDASLYRTNLRDPIENFYPLGASCPGPPIALTSYPINVGNVVYQGAEIRFVQRFDHVFMNAQYGLNVAYPYNLPAAVANPTSGGNLVTNQQFLGIPQQVGSLGIDWQNLGWHGALDMTFRGPNNELHQGPFTVLNGGFGKNLGRRLDLTLALTNITNAAAGRFTLPGNGAPYRGTIGLTPQNQPIYGLLPTDRLFVESFGLRLILTMRK